MNILMVCLGNICRSPLAEGLLRHKLLLSGLDKENIVDSAGTSGFHAGDNPDIRSSVHAKKKGLNISNLISRQFTIDDFDKFDLIYVMDQRNLDNVLELARNEKDKAKVELILNLSHPSKNLPVPDPYYGGEQGFENVYNLLDGACEIIIKNLKK